MEEISTKPKLQILYQDEYLIAINKPHGLLVHRSRIATDAKEFALQMLRDQVGKFVSPVHRIDRKTSGILLFALDKDTARLAQEEFTSHRIQKKYLAIVRGWFPEELLVNRPLMSERGNEQEAETFFKLIKKSEINVPLGKHTTSRYSLVEAFPKTGRMHQIRRHLNHLRHPIIGDRPHGCNKQNRFFKAKWEMNKMLLHAKEMQILHPHTKELLIIQADLSSAFLRMLEVLELNK